MEFATYKTRFLEGCGRLHPLTDTFSKVLRVARKYPEVALPLLSFAQLKDLHCAYHRGLSSALKKDF